MGKQKIGERMHIHSLTLCWAWYNNLVSFMFVFVFLLVFVGVLFLFGQNLKDLATFITPLQFL